jgi:flagellar basal body rod protein FlgB
MKKTKEKTMKSTTVRFAAILMMLGVFAIVSLGQKTERVKFAAGSTQASFTRTIPARGSIDFVINAKAGQYMDYTPAYDLKKTDIQVFLTEPKLQDASRKAKIDERNVFKINTSGEHYLTVNNMTGKNVTFTLYLQVTNEDPDADDSETSSGNTNDGDVERIQLPKNAVFTDLAITLEPGETKQFVANVKKGFKVCIESNKKLGSNVKIGVDAKILNMNNSATNTACTAKAIENGDQYIFFENTGRNRISFTATVAFYTN